MPRVNEYISSSTQQGGWEKYYKPPNDTSRLFSCYNMIEQPNEAEHIRRLVGEVCALEDVNQLEVLYREIVVLFAQRIHSAEKSWQDLLKLMETKISRPDPLFFRMFNEIVTLTYTQNSQLVHILYECLPELLIKFQSYLQLGVEEKENNNRLKGTS